jgi:DNA-directed RNA polymerase specialized sigma subunit
MSLRIEPEYRETYENWKKSPNPESNSSMVTALDSVIDKGVKMYGAGSPLDRSKAKLLALNSLDTYDPTRAKLQSHVLNHMKGLQRFQNKRVLRLPERDAIAISKLSKETQELEDRLGREPTDDELSDFLHISVPRLTQLRKKRGFLNTGNVGSTNDAVEGVSSRIPGDNSDQMAWIDYILPELSPADQQILTYSLGLHGQAKLNNQQLAEKLNITPGAVSQRKLNIQRILDKQSELSPWG